MNPLKIFEYEPLDRTKLSWPAKVLVFFIEWIARILGAIYVSIALLIVSIIPFPGASKTFFRIIGTMSDMYRTKYMSDEYGNGTEGMDKTDEPEVSQVESNK